jgi:hypothetical protein
VVFPLRKSFQQIEFTFNVLYVARFLRCGASSQNGGQHTFSEFRGNFPGEALLPMSPRIEAWRIETVMGAIDEKLKGKTPRTRCVFGHWAYCGIEAEIWPGAPARTITFLREPIERCISLYGFIKSRPDNPFHAELMRNGTLERCVEAGQMLEFFNGQTRRLCFEGAASSELLRERILTRDHLEHAKARLRAMWFVGLTETFDEDSLVLYGRMGFRRFYPERVINATGDKPAASPNVRAALAQANALDLELWEYARQLRDEWRREHAHEVASWERRAQIRKRIYRIASTLKGARRVWKRS